MSVNLRRRKNKDGSTSLVLDIYHNGKRRFEFLDECKLCKPKTPQDRTSNANKLALAEQIKNMTSLRIGSDQYGVTPAYLKDVDFFTYFEGYLSKYTKKDKRVLNACYGKFRLFAASNGYKVMAIKQVDENLAEDFKDYLEHHMKGETPANYFKKFKKVLQQAVRDKMLSSNPANEITASKSEGIKKEILTFDELQKLADTKCTNEQVKRAFLFCCVTGMRFCDVKKLTWSNINGSVLKYIQSKTNNEVSVNLNDTGLNLLGLKGKKNELVFILPSHTSCTKGIGVWCKNAGIDKHITWHCARHSFATNIIFYGSDVNNARALLGHNSLTYTQRYLRVVEELKERAVQNLPQIHLKSTD
jgi:integrase/recombinase XerD